MRTWPKDYIEIIEAFVKGYEKVIPHGAKDLNPAAISSGLKEVIGDINHDFNSSDKSNARNLLGSKELDVYLSRRANLRSYVGDNVVD